MIDVSLPLVFEETGVEVTLESTYKEEFPDEEDCGWFRVTISPGSFYSDGLSVKKKTSFWYESDGQFLGAGNYYRLVNKNAVLKPSLAHLGLID